MPNLNRVMLMGNLTRDPELKTTTSNKSVCQIGLAINHQWKSESGEKKEEVTFIDCEAWGRTAEVINEHLRKGRPIYIEGRLKLDQWQDKDGGKRSKLKVVIESFEFIDGKRDEQSQQPAPQSQPRQQSRPHTNTGPHQPVDDPPF